ncbi:MAG: glucosaminidase domain-containing protein [Synergistaceae bacterium]|nr:glucosaminidase domain-containing protein [Synergistaceae bacterium]
MKKSFALFILTFVLIIICGVFQASSSEAMSSTIYYQMAQKYKDTINPFAAMVQSAHETGYWTSRLWALGYNGAGLKADRKWRSTGRPCISKHSTESANGRYHTKHSYFRKYGSPKEFFMDYAAKIKRDYPLCVRNRDNIWGYLAGLYRGRIGKWATDHKYYEKLSDKVMKLAPEIYSDRWKDELLKDYKTAKNSSQLEGWQIDIIEKNLTTAGVLR